MRIHWILNTTNPGKMAEFQQLFAKKGLHLTGQQVDIQEIDADPLTVIIHKASVIDEHVLVDDTSLDIDRAAVGIHVRWLLSHLPQYVGRKALCRVLLAYRSQGLVRVFEGKVRGTIVEPKGTGGFGFDPCFRPEDHALTLAEDKPDSVNPRSLAVDALISNSPITIVPPLTEWLGPWQHGK